MLDPHFAKMSNEDLTIQDEDSNDLTSKIKGLNQQE